MDLHVKSQELLEALANSIHDRAQKGLSPFCFTINEVHLCEEWLKQFSCEVRQDCTLLGPWD